MCQIVLAVSPQLSKNSQQRCRLLARCQVSDLIIGTRQDQSKSKQKIWSCLWELKIVTFALHSFGEKRTFRCVLF